MATRRHPLRCPNPTCQARNPSDYSLGQGRKSKHGWSKLSDGMATFNKWPEKMSSRPDLVRQLSAHARTNGLLFDYWTTNSGIIARRIAKADPGEKGRLSYKGVVRTDDILSTITNFNDTATSGAPL